MTFDDLPQIARDVVRQAMGSGASSAECTIAEGQEFSVNVRMREVETLKEAGSRGAGVASASGMAGGLEL